MKFSDACWRLPPIVLAIVAISLGACAMGGSEQAPSACPPVATYPTSFQARAAAELEALPAGSAIEAMLVNYSLMRVQARACAQ